MIDREKIIDTLMERAEKATRPGGWLLPIVFCILMFLMGGVWGQWIGMWRMRRQAIREGCPGWQIPRDGGEAFFRFGPLEK